MCPIQKRARFHPDLFSNSIFNNWSVNIKPNKERGIIQDPWNSCKCAAYPAATFHHIQHAPGLEELKWFPSVFLESFKKLSTSVAVALNKWSSFFSNTERLTHRQNVNGIFNKVYRGLFFFIVSSCIFYIDLNFVPTYALVCMDIILHRQLHL